MALPENTLTGDWPTDLKQILIENSRDIYKTLDNRDSRRFSSTPRVVLLLFPAFLIFGWLQHSIINDRLQQLQFHLQDVESKCLGKIDDVRRDIIRSTGAAYGGQTKEGTHPGKRQVDSLANSRKNSSRGVTSTLTAIEASRCCSGSEGIDLERVEERAARTRNESSTRSMSYARYDGLVRAIRKISRLFTSVRLQYRRLTNRLDDVELRVSSMVVVPTIQKIGDEGSRQADVSSAYCQPSPLNTHDTIRADEDSNHASENAYDFILERFADVERRSANISSRLGFLEERATNLWTIQFSRGLGQGEVNQDDSNSSARQSIELNDGATRKDRSEHAKYLSSLEQSLLSGSILERLVEMEQFNANITNELKKFYARRDTREVSSEEASRRDFSVDASNGTACSLCATKQQVARIQQMMFNRLGILEEQVTNMKQIDQSANDSTTIKINAMASPSTPASSTLLENELPIVMERLAELEHQSANITNQLIILDSRRYSGEESPRRENHSDEKSEKVCGVCATKEQVAKIQQMMIRRESITKFERDWTSMREDWQIFESNSRWVLWVVAGAAGFSVLRDLWKDLWIALFGA